jgi:hypothetical protein
MTIAALLHDAVEAGGKNNPEVDSRKDLVTEVAQIVDAERRGHQSQNPSGGHAKRAYLDILPAGTLFAGFAVTFDGFN